MKHLLLLTTLAAACCLPVCNAPAAPPEKTPNASGAAALSKKETAVLISAARVYLKANSAPEVGETRIKVEQVEGDYARLNVTPVKPTTDPATLYLHKNAKGVWEGIALGTGWAPEDYDKLHIPAALRN